MQNTVKTDPGLIFFVEIAGFCRIIKISLIFQGNSYCERQIHRHICNPGVQLYIFMVIGIFHLGFPVIADAHMIRMVLTVRMLDYRIDQFHLAYIILKGLDNGRGGTDFSPQKWGSVTGLVCHGIYAVNTDEAFIQACGKAVTGYGRNKAVCFSGQSLIYLLKDVFCLGITEILTDTYPGNQRVGT